ncbi:helix-turn-helix transcriptional regulator [Gardnerella sp. DNF00354]|uniref:helix-turn-helix transcriptional regulator n=1 Tax=Gardnerella TaxID=2701 RepID=UPI000E31278C|nr:helix-turn-helix transcriptional regulator [Gardnerella vaginalis]MCT7871346.1 helix-turn-helix domain-containing protein [Lactobacillus crispatus]RFD74327.1 transcriptional regulator [Gardnerella vaginalis]
MVSVNIRALRRSKKLTQQELAEALGVSRNSIVRYENGTSAISTRLIDKICNKFKVSLFDIVHEKELSASDKYDLNMKIEVLKERGALLLARLYKYEDSMNIQFDDSSNAWIAISDDLSDVINTKIYTSTNFEDINRYIGYLDGIERLLEYVSCNKNS